MPIVVVLLFLGLFFVVLVLGSVALWWIGRSSDPDRTPQAVEARQRLLFRVEGVLSREGFSATEWADETERRSELRSAGFPRRVSLPRLEELLTQTKVPGDTNAAIMRDELRALVDAAKSLILRKRLTAVAGGLQAGELRATPEALEALEALEVELGTASVFHDDVGVPIDFVTIELNHPYRRTFERVEARQVVVGDEVVLFYWRRDGATGRAVDFSKPGRVARVGPLDDRHFVKISVADGRRWHLDGGTYVLRRRAA
jgi:hypothetical protein